MSINAIDIELSMAANVKGSLDLYIVDLIGNACYQRES